MSVPYPRTKETLAAIQGRGAKIGAVTSRSKMTSISTLELADLLPFFDTVISMEDAPAIKPSPEPLLVALTNIGSDPSRAVMIGDSHLDIEAGKNAGTRTVRMTSGFHADHLHDPEPDFIISDIGDLLEIDFS